MVSLLDAIKTQSKITESVLVSFSMGKDSIVTLDLCFKYFKHVQLFFMYLVPNLEFQEQALQKYERHCNTEIIRVPHDTLTEAQTAQALANLGISRDTWLKEISIVDDPRQEERAMDDEHAKQIQENLDVLKSNHSVTDGENNDDSSTRKEKD